MGALSTVFNASYPNSESWIYFRDEFNTTLQTALWTTVKDSGAAVATAAVANGTLTITSTATTDNDGGSVQMPNAWVLPTSGKQIALQVRAKISDATQSDFYVGLATTFVTNPENVLTAASKIGFQKADGSAVPVCITASVSVETQVSSQRSMVDDTYVVFGLYYNGAGQVNFYMDDVYVGAITTNIPALVMTPALFSLSGDASGTKISTYDYVMLAVER